MDIVEQAFEAGRRRGRDEMYSTTLKFPDEIKQPDYEEWVKTIKGTTSLGDFKSTGTPHK